MLVRFSGAKCFGSELFRIGLEGLISLSPPPSPLRKTRAFHTKHLFTESGIDLNGEKKVFPGFPPGKIYFSHLPFTLRFHFPWEINYPGRRKSSIG